MKLLKSFSVYALTTIFNKGIGFLLLPVFTYYFTPKDYGTLSLINTILAVVTPFILLQVRGAISVEFYKSNNKDSFNNYFVSALTNPLFSFVGVSILLILIYQPLADWLAIDSFWILLVPIMAIFSMLPQISQTIFQVSERPIPFGIFSLSKTSLELGLSLLLVISFGLNYQGRLIGILITGLVFSGVAFFLLKKQKLFTGAVSKNFRKQALWFGLPLIPHAIGAIIINASDRIFIAKMVSIDELGIYNVGYAIGSIIMIIEHSFTQAWTPFLFKNLKENTIQSKKAIIKVSYLFMFFLLVCAIGLTLVAPFLFKSVLAEEYSNGVIYVFWVAMGFVFSGFYKIMTGYIYYLKKTKYLGYLSIFSVIMNLTLNYLLIAQFGAIGAAYATFISFFLLFFITTLISNRIYPMPWLKVFST